MPNPPQSQSPFDPTDQPAPQSAPANAGPPQAGDPSLLGQWGDWMGKPENKAALMQFGIAMLQPMQQGETGTSHFANAVGYGGEASANVTKQAQTAKTAEDTSQLREAQANLAQERAAHTGETSTLRAQNAAAGLDLKRAGLENTIQAGQFQQERARTMADIAQSNAWSRQVNEISKRNANHALMGEPTEPVPTKQEFDASVGYIPGGGYMSPTSQGANALGGTQPVASGGTKPRLADIQKADPQRWAQLQQLPPGAARTRAINHLRGIVSDQDQAALNTLEKGP